MPGRWFGLETADKKTKLPVQKGSLSPKPCSQHLTKIFFSKPFQKEFSLGHCPAGDGDLCKRDAALMQQELERAAAAARITTSHYFPQIVPFLGRLGGSSSLSCLNPEWFPQEERDELKWCRICVGREIETSPWSFQVIKVNFKEGEN